MDNGLETQKNELSATYLKAGVILAGTQETR
jgi:hypothetical protein